MKRLEVFVSHSTPIIMALGSITWGLWILFIIDLNVIMYWRSFQEIASHSDLANYGIYIPRMGYNLDVNLIKPVIGLPPLIWGSLNIWLISSRKFNYKKLAKAGLFLYWFTITIWTIYRNFESVMLPFYLTYTVTYLVLYLRIDND